MDSWFEIFTLLTGILYIVLEIRQHRFMWAVGVLTAVAAMVVFFRQGLYASFALNTYYLIVSFWGLWQWARRPLSSDEEKKGSVYVRKLSWQVLLSSAVLLLSGTFALGWLATILGDPMSYLDVFVAVLSAIATWWLARCHNEQWLLWIIADACTTVLCMKSALTGADGMWWMVILYVAYTISAIYGFLYWKWHSV